MATARCRIVSGGQSDTIHVTTRMTSKLVMSQQEKWKGMFGRLRNCRGPKRRRTLSVKATNGSLDPGTELSKDDEIGNVSVSEVNSWSDSFEKLMSSESGRKVFRSFLRCEYSEENILFWLACEDLKHEPNSELIEEKARIIYEDFVSILSPREVSLDSRVREIINRNMIAPSQNTFDDAQLQIYTLMHRDSYPRFVSSTQYKDLLQTTIAAANADAAKVDGTSASGAGATDITSTG